MNTFASIAAALLRRRRPARCTRFKPGSTTRGAVGLRCRSLPPYRCYWKSNCCNGNTWARYWEEIRAPGTSSGWRAADEEFPRATGR